MTQRRTIRAGFTLVEAMILVAVLLAVVALAVPGVAHLRQKARQAQNSMQLGAIAHCMESWSLSSRVGGREGWYPGLDRRTGGSIAVGDAIPAAQLAASADVPGYAERASEHLKPGEMNAAPGRGFIVRAMAELLAGDYIRADSASFFINPADSIKTPFVAGASGAAGRFTAANISYTTLDISKSDGGVFPFQSTWSHRGDNRSVLLADRAVGDGNDPATRSSVWTHPGSGEWHGWAALHDGSTLWTMSPANASFRDARYDGLGFAAGPPANAFGRGLVLVGTTSAISATSGILYDEADSGTDPNAF